MKCPFFAEFGKWIVDQGCPYLRTDGDFNETDGYCKKTGGNSSHFSGCGKGGSWCAKMIGRAMLSHKIWIGNDY